MRSRLFLLVLLGLLSCRVLNRVRNKFYILMPPGRSAQILRGDDGPVHQLVLDDSYRLYVRQICRPRPPAGFYQSGNPNQVAEVKRCDCDDPAVTYPKEKLEIEYLLLSERQQAFVYITTVPPDVKQGKMRYDQPLFMLANFVNLRMLNTIFIGRTDGLKKELQLDRLGQPAVPGVFEGPERWQYEVTGGGQVLTLHTISQEDVGYGRYAVPERILAMPVRFYHQPNWVIGLSKKYDQTTLAAAEVQYLTNKTIYWVREPKQQPRWLVLKLDATPPAGPATVVFHGDRIMGLAPAP